MPTIFHTNIPATKANKALVEEIALVISVKAPVYFFCYENVYTLAVPETLNESTAADLRQQIIQQTFKSFPTFAIHATEFERYPAFAVNAAQITQQRATLKELRVQLTKVPRSSQAYQKQLMQLLESNCLDYAATPLQHAFTKIQESITAKLEKCAHLKELTQVEIKWLYDRFKQFSNAVELDHQHIVLGKIDIIAWWRSYVLPNIPLTLTTIPVVSEKENTSPATTNALEIRLTLRDIRYIHAHAKTLANRFRMLMHKKLFDETAYNPKLFFSLNDNVLTFSLKNIQVVEKEKNHFHQDIIEILWELHLETCTESLTIAHPKAALRADKFFTPSLPQDPNIFFIPHSLFFPSTPYQAISQPVDSNDEFYCHEDLVSSYQL